MSSRSRATLENDVVLLRQGSLASVVLVALVLGACGSGSGDVRPAGDPRLAEPGRSVASPSGDYELEVVTGDYGGAEGRGGWWRVRIRDSSGEVVLDSPKRFSARFETLALWDERAERAWVHSTDVGTYYWEPDRQGRWTGAVLGPEGIASADPPVPRLLVEREPEVFGREGREQARAVVRERGVEHGPQGVPPDDPRLKLPE